MSNYHYEDDYIVFINQGKEEFRRKLLGFTRREKINFGNNVFYELSPDFELFEGEERLEDFSGNIFIDKIYE